MYVAADYVNLRKERIKADIVEFTPMQWREIKRRQYNLKDKLKYV